MTAPAPAGTVLVADLGGTSVKLGFNVKGRPHDYVRLFPAAGLRNPDPVGSLAAMIDAVIEETALRPDLIMSTVPGFLDSDEDRVLFAGNIPELNGRHLASDLRALLAIPVVLERDSVLALLGETLAGAGQGVGKVLGVFFGTGIGAAFIEDGRPFRGAGWALEIGHMPFKGEGRELDGLRTDCLEAYVSGRALESIAQRHGVPIEGVFATAGENPDLSRALAGFVRDQAFAIGTAVALFSPDAIVLGGGVCAMREFPRARLAALVEANAPFAQTGRRMDLRWAELGWRSALYGAPHAAREHFRRRQQQFGAWSAEHPGQQRQSTSTGGAP